MEYHDTPIEWNGKEVNYFIPKKANAQILSINEQTKPITNLKEKLFSALEDPVDLPALQKMIDKYYRAGKDVLILVDDNTRPNIHSRKLLPLLFPKLIEMGVAEKDLKILIASGTHRPPTDDEIKDKILGPAIWEKYQEHVITHDCNENVEQIGTSSRETPIFLNKRALEAALIIALTDSEYHYFAGVAGTVKQLCPGIAGRKTISRNHPKMFDKEKGFKPACRLGNTEENPVIEDMIEIAELIKKDHPIFCIDAIINNKEIVFLKAGDIISLHKLARENLKPLRVLRVEEEGDLVIMSPGDLALNLYQAGKGIHAAWNAAKKGGRILLVARAQDGVGNDAYEETMEQVKDMALDEALKWVIDHKCNEQTFRIGNQKPVDLLRILKENQIDMITEMDHKKLQEIFRINPIDIAENLQQTLRKYVKEFLANNENGLIYVMVNADIYVRPNT
jgi:nickel-dependent lactate racemase